MLEIWTTTSRKPDFIRRCQEASPFQPLTSCRQGCIKLSIHTRPSRRRSSISPRVKSLPLFVLVRSERSVCAWSLSLSCRRSCSSSPSLPPVASMSLRCCVHACFAMLASSIYCKERSLLVPIALVRPSSASVSAPSSHSAKVTLREP